MSLERPVERGLPFSGLSPSQLPTLDELGIRLGHLEGQPFGRDESGNPIGGESGPIQGLLAALRESVAERVERELVERGIDAAEREPRVAAAQQAAIERLVAMLNAAQPDPRYHITVKYLQDARHRFSYEFWTFGAEFARIISGDRELVFRSGFRSIPSSVARLARPFGVEGTFRAVTRLSALLVRSDLESVGTTSSTATIRWPGAWVPEVVPAVHVPAYYALGCQAFRGGLAAVPSVVGGLAKADVVEHQCHARGAPYCEWEFRWQAKEGKSGRRTLAAAAGLSAAALAASLARLRGSRLIGTLAAGVLPLVVARQQARIRQLNEEKDSEHRLLLEQRELSEVEYGNRAQAYVELQEKNLELEHRVSELTALTEVGRAVATTLNLDAVLDASLAAVVTYGRYQRALVLLHDPTTDSLTGGRSAGGSARERQAVARYQVDLRRKGSLLAQVFASDEPMLLDIENAADAAAQALAAELGVTSFLGTPLITQGRKLGVLAVDHGRSGPVPDESDKELIFTIGSLIASAVERAQLYAEIERHSRDLEVRVEQRTEELARATEEAQSARRAAEERHQQFETIFRHTPVAMITTAEDGVTVTSWNPAAERLFGYTAAEAKGRNIDDLVTNAELRAEGDELNRRAVREGAVKVVTRRAHRDGHLVDVEMQAMRVLVAGSSIGVVAIYHDVTELLQARRESEAARAQAEAANEAKSRFLSNVSHELRTPLTSVLGFAKIIGKRLDEVILPAVDLDDPKRERAVRQVRDNIAIIVAEGERLTTMINNVLDLAKIESGRFEWKEEEIAVTRLLQHAASATASLFATKNLELRQDVPEALPMVRGDPDRLLQVVINLLSNAVKFTDGGWVAMRAAAVDGEVIVSVEDTGVGIAPEDYSTVFEQFRQVGDTLTDKPHGTGLGLPISREIVEHHGGRLWLESEPGRGSTFRFSLPAAPWTPSATTPAPGSVVGSAGDGSPLVLVVDDDRSTRELLRQELEARGYTVIEAADGRAAISLARERSPRLVVLDVVMPEPDGFDVAAALKADPVTATTPILMLTVLDAPERAQQAGVESFVTKPFDADGLMGEVARLCPAPARPG